MESTTPYEIRAEIDRDAIRRVSRFFSGSLASMLAEVLQNARRSGATRIDIGHDAATGEITVRDNGRGIAEPADLLRFGRSSWNGEVASEDPAGMGAYALAGTTTTYRSRTAGTDGWMVDLGVRHYQGTRAALVMPLNGGGKELGDHGTEVAFIDPQWQPGKEDQRAKAVEAAVRTAARHHPTATFWRGNRIEQASFIADRLAEVEHDGLRIGLVHGYSASWNGQLDFNFHGLLLVARLPEIATANGCIRARAEVHGPVDGLELTLPARAEIVENDFATALRTRAERAIFEYMAGEGICGASYHVYRRAAELGIELPVPAEHLHAWTPELLWTEEWGRARRRRQRKTEPIAATPPGTSERTMMVIPENVDAAMGQTIWQAVQQAGSHAPVVLLEGSINLRGYDWYDGLRHLSKAEILYTQEGRTLVAGEEEKDRHRDGRVTNLRVRLTAAPVRGTVDTITVELPVAFAFPVESHDIGTLDEATVLVDEAGAADLSPVVLQDALVDAYFCPSDDPESDSSETQEQNAIEEAEAVALEILLGKEEQVRRMLENRIVQAAVEHLPNTRGATVRIAAGRPRKVEVELGPENEAEAR